MRLAGMYGFTWDEMEPYFYCVCAFPASFAASDLSFLRCACHVALLDRILDCMQMENSMLPRSMVVFPHRRRRPKMMDQHPPAGHYVYVSLPWPLDRPSRSLRWSPPSPPPPTRPGAPRAPPAGPSLPPHPPFPSRAPLKSAPPRLVQPWLWYSPSLTPLRLVVSQKKEGQEPTDVPTGGAGGVWGAAAC